MGRPKRADAAGGFYHMLNRGNLKAQIFFKDEDYAAFESLLCEAIERFDIKLLSFCIMPNHWHLVVSPNIDGEMGRFAQWVSLTHTQRYHAHYDLVGVGHLYQGRFKSFPVQSDEHFLTINRYVERNAYKAKLCGSPEAWRWGSLYHWNEKSPLSRDLLSAWPIPRHPDWIEWVKTDFSQAESKRIQWSVSRGVPFGDDRWVETVARKYDLESTMRPRGRPKSVS